MCITLIITQLIMMEQSAQGFAALNEENIYENLQESIHYFTKQVDSMRTTAIKLSQDITVRKAAKEESSEYAIWEAAKKIEEYSTDLWQAGVWFQQDNSILYNVVKLKPEEFYNMVAGEQDACQEMFKQFFETEDLMRVMSTVSCEATANNILLVAKPVSFVSVVEKDATVFFVIHGDKVESKELSELELLDSAFFAIDQKVSSQKKLLVNFMISDLLSGKPVDEHLLKESIGGSCVLAFGDFD